MTAILLVLASFGFAVSGYSLDDSALSQKGFAVIATDRRPGDQVTANERNATAPQTRPLQEGFP